MRCEPEHFGDQDLPLLYIARKLDEALKVEALLTDAGLDYLVEPDKYKGGIIFQSERIGAFFYVAEQDAITARQQLQNAGYKPYDAGEDS